MAIRKIMVPLFGQSGGAGDEVSQASLRVGLSTGRLLQCHVEACCLAADLPMPRRGIFEDLSSAAVEPLFEEIERRNQGHFWHARSLFDQAVEVFCPARPEAGSSAPNFSAGFLEFSGDVTVQAALRGRLADLTVLATNEVSFSGEYRHFIHALLTETGRPLFVVPVAQEQIALDHVAIAWNGTAEATRAVAMLLGLLERAQSVTLLGVKEDGAEEGDLQDFAAYLAWHGLEAEIMEVEQGARGIGQALQEEAMQAGAEVMVMGAYTRGQIRRLAFGGASGEILRAPQLPVIMVD
jgi:nucleotide-binding universal stress UspA family protein